MIRNKSLKHGVRSMDAFGTPVNVKYKGESSYKTVSGGVLTIAVVFIVMIMLLCGLGRIAGGDDAEYSTFSVSNARARDDAFNVAQSNGQMYVGLKQSTLNTDGSVSETIVPIDTTSINAKVDYWANGVL